MEGGEMCASYIFDHISRSHLHNVKRFICILSKKQIIEILTPQTDNTDGQSFLP